MPRGPRAILFDLDGTLVDTMPAFADLAADVMATRHGAARAAARARYLATSGIPFVRQLEAIHPGDPRNAAASEEFEARKRAICDATPLDDATVAALAALRALGLRLVLSSNTGQEVVDAFVQAERVAFDLALGYDPARGLGKGEPHVASTLRAFDLQRADLLFVGDSLADLDLARAAGIDFVGRLGTFDAAAFAAHGARRTIGHVAELPALLADEAS